jgi:Protein kinase domain
MAHAVEGGELLLVMPKADKTLRDAIDGGLDDEHMLEAFQNIAKGLVELHGIPIVHRDLKPQNVLLHDGRWKLSDFGIAKEYGDTTSTLTWKGAGTLPYMAPELFVPPGVASPKSDLYAMGCVGFEMWSGSTPFHEEDPVKLLAEIKDVAAPPLADSVPPSVRRLIARLLNKDPAARPQDARAVAEELSRVVVGPLGPEAERLQHLVLGHAQERAAESVAAAAMRSQRDRQRQTVAQAMSDLFAIVATGVELIQQAIPDVVAPNLLTIRSEDASVALEVWQNSIEKAEPTPFATLGSWGAATAAIQRHDDHLLYGVVGGWNRRTPRDVVDRASPLANLVCELVGDRLQWFLCRYRMFALGAGGGYTLGPENRRHGFERGDFESLHVFPYAFRDWGGIHAFKGQFEVLTPELIRELFMAALALPDDIE